VTERSPKTLNHQTREHKRKGKLIYLAVSNFILQQSNSLAKASK
jgi:hypothetical protein